MTLRFYPLVVSTALLGGAADAASSSNAAFAPGGRPIGNRAVSAAQPTAVPVAIGGVLWPLFATSPTKDDLLSELSTLTSSFEGTAFVIEKSRLEYERKMGSYRRRVENFEFELNEERRKADEAVREARELTSTVEVLRRELGEVEAVVSEARIERDASVYEEEKARDAVDGVKLQLEAAEKRADEAQKAVESQRAKLASAERTASDLRDELVAIRAEAEEDAAVAFREREASLAAATAERDECALKGNELEDSFARSEFDLADLREELTAELTAKDAELERDKAAVASLVDEHESDRTQFTNRMYRFENKRKLWGTEKEDMIVEREVLLREAEEMQADLEVMELKGEELQMKDEALRSTEDGLRERAEEWEEERKALNARIEELGALEARSNDLQQKLDAAEAAEKKDAAAFEKARDALAAERDALESRTSELRSAEADAVRSYESVVTSLEANFAAERSQWETARADAGVAKVDLANGLESLKETLEGRATKGGGVESVAMTKLRAEIEEAAEAREASKAKWDVERKALAAEKDALVGKADALKEWKGRAEKVRLEREKFEKDSAAWDGTWKDLQEAKVNVQKRVEELQADALETGEKLKAALKDHENAQALIVSDRSKWEKDRDDLKREKVALTERVRSMRGLESRVRAAQAAVDKAGSDADHETQTLQKREDDLALQLKSLEEKVESLLKFEEEERELKDAIRSAEEGHTTKRSAWEEDRSALLADKVGLLKTTADLGEVEARGERLRLDLEAGEEERSGWVRDRLELEGASDELMSEMDALAEESTEVQEKVRKEGARETIDATAAIIRERVGMVERTEAALKEREAARKEMEEKLESLESERHSLRKLTMLGLRRVGSFLRFWKRRQEPDAAA